MPSDAPDKSLLRRLPKVDQVLDHPDITALDGRVPVLRVKEAVRQEIEERRTAVLTGDIRNGKELELGAVASAASLRAERLDLPNLRKVINATGVVVHTNLGRCPLPPEALERIGSVSSGYSTLEYDVAQGERGSRDDLIEQLICDLTGAEAATVVNNNAAAVMLVLREMAAGMGVVVSRGELVEIGGSFRIPDVMEASGARLVEVGTTNRTRIEDYRKGSSGDVSLLLKVHTSNYRIVGFAEEAEIDELVELGRKLEIPVAVDLGSGSLVDLRTLGLKYHEPTVGEVLKQGADVVTFSGDKLLGGPQAGIIVGSKKHINAIRKNPMKRALRVGKLTLAALEAVLRMYLDPATAVRQVPALGMMAAPKDAVASRARRFAARLADLPAATSTFSSVSKVGGGALPLEEIPTMLLALEAEGLSAQDLEKRLREHEPPVVGRIVDDKLCLDLRTVSSKELPLLEKAIREALKGEQRAARSEK
jgi:L-seryl-tRNA(Ser) seleniumtransferase